MNQVVQDIRTGQLKVALLPAPLVRPGHVLIANAASVISSGTEKSLIELARKSLVGKAIERPDQVRRVLEKIRNEGFIRTVGQVRKKLDEPMSMGNSSAGVVLACGSDVQSLKPGDRVASNGPHADVVCVPKNLCARIPDNVSFEQAAFAVLGAIALQGIRLSRVSLGETVLVIGLGLIGQITVGLLRAAGIRVIGTDLDGAKCESAFSQMEADVSRPGISAKEILQQTAGHGADAVIITASTKSKAPMDLAAESVRSKGRVVLVGVVGLELDRRPFFFKEAEFVVSCSYGPGRYDPMYEERGRDYPYSYVRWTEQRNIQAVLDQMGAGRLDISPLITHRFPVEKAEEAYGLIQSGKDPYLGIVLIYPDMQDNRTERRIQLKVSKTKVRGKIKIGCIGAGNFARMILFPAINRIPDFQPRLICSALGLSAAHSGVKFGFAEATTDEEEVFNDQDIDAVFILTQHHQHAKQVVRAIEAGKHVFVEKPLALSLEEIEKIESALMDAGDSSPLVMVGFNRRFSPAARAVRNFFEDSCAPRTVSVRFNAGQIPPEHWSQDLDVGGGRIIGEACHGIDLATFLTNSPPVRVYAESIFAKSESDITDDQCFITLRHANGSVSSVAYLAGGDKAFPKERVEVFGGGRVAVIDDFREVVLCNEGKIKRHRNPGQDKGHSKEIERFAEALKRGQLSPIPWSEIRAVSLSAILAVRSIREGIPFVVPSPFGCSRNRINIS